MSRSRKKSLFVGITTARSDKPWKRKAARIFRQSARRALAATLDGDDLPVRRWSLTHPWDAPKDGKQRLADPTSPWLRK